MSEHGKLANGLKSIKNKLYRSIKKYIMHFTKVYYSAAALPVVILYVYIQINLRRLSSL